MQSLDVYKYLNTLVRSGSDHHSHRRESPKNLNKTFKGDKFDIHVFTSHAECLQILKDANFMQPKMAGAIMEIFGSLGLQPKFIEDFLRKNPIGMDGAAHHAAKQLFLAQYRSTQRDLSPTLPIIAERVFTDFIDGEKSHILTDLVEPYVDSVVEAIFSNNNSLQINRDRWRGNSSCIFEYVHPIRKLKDKDAQAFALARHLESGLESKEVGAIPILLTYVLQGRDGLPPEKWSSLMYGFRADGGLRYGQETQA